MSNRNCKFDEYILVGPGSDYGMVMWNDIGKINGGTVLYSTLKPVNKVVEFLYKLHFSFEINKHIHLPLQGIWGKSYSLNEISIKPNKEYCIIFTDISAGRTDINYLQKLKKKGNIHLNLVLVNTMRHRKQVLKNRIPIFDYVFSFDKDDCDKYGYIYHPMNYSIVDLPEKSSCNLSGAFFVGKAVDREETITALFEMLRNSGVNPLFYIAKSKSKKRNPNITYNKWLSYEEVLSNISGTECIVEIMNGIQSGSTLRAMEAICYNKRLLTNNKGIKQSPFYNEEFIQIFETISDINIDFFTKDIDVDYKYNGEFSPVNFIKHIDEIYSKCEENY